MDSANIIQLNAVVKAQGRHALLRQMGYHNLDKSLKRLDALLNSPSVYAWTTTKREGFDFKYTTIEFIRELYKAAGFADVTAELVINEVHDREARIKAFPRYDIFIDTGFKRKNQPIFVLAFSEGMRHIRCSKELLIDMSEDEKQDYFKALIKSHYQDSNGTLMTWGTIKYYVVFAGDTKKIVYFPDGSVAPISEDINTAKAVLELNGKDIVPMITCG